MRRLTNDELNKLKFLTSKQIEVSLIEPTTTGLKKSIMDATAPVRDFLARERLHDFTTQLQGPEAKKIIGSKIITFKELVNTHTSLYRPVTKKGDPRLWISGIPKYCSPGDILAIAHLNGYLWIFNLSTLDIITLYHKPSVFANFISTYESKENEISSELLEKIRAISKKGFIASPYRGDTAIGRLLEDELGIAINSSKDPDYKGIELKSARSERKNRKNLFAQVPDWDISKLKSSKAILDLYGYEKEGALRLYCTVTATQFNPQTLRLKVNMDSGVLTEYSSRDGDVVNWRLRNLEDRLLSKHKETFWVEAISKTIDGVEHFKFTRIEHTRDPIASQLSVLIDQGKITLDHLIKQKGLSVVEKGPIFKLEKRSLALLFPPSEIYELQ